MGTVLYESLQAWWPEALLSAGALATIVTGAWTRRADPPLAVAWGTLSAAAVALWLVPVPPATDLFFGLIVCDPFSLAFRWIALGVTALVILLTSTGSGEVEPARLGEYLGLVLLVGVGLMLTAEANHLLMAYVALELVSLNSYLLVAFTQDSRSAEAGLKYLLIGALSSGLMLFGMSLLFGLTGQLAFPGLLAAQAMDQASLPPLLMSVALVLAGLAFKISMVPFHLWTPDAYEGAPLPIAALLSVGPKAAGLALLLRVVAVLDPVWGACAPWLWALTILTMTLGNVVALVQTNIKRLLAYSTIGQVGYLLIGVVISGSTAQDALIVYLVAYLFMNLGLFACASAVVEATGSESLDAFAGLSRRAPGLAALTALFLLSLAGLPPLLGFFGKFLLFGAAVKAGQGGLAIAGIANSALALYYYVNIIRLMYVTAPRDARPLRPSAGVRLAAGVCALVTVGVGLAPGWLLGVVSASRAMNLL